MARAGRLFDFVHRVHATFKHGALQARVPSARPGLGRRGRFELLGDARASGRDHSGDRCVVRCASLEVRRRCEGQGWQLTIRASHVLGLRS